MSTGRRALGPPLTTLSSPGRGLEPLSLRGNAALLGHPLIGLFCSVRCPGSAILRALEWVKTLPPFGADGPRIISGFHSPIEQECLRGLIRRQVVTIVCPAREIARYHWPVDWDEPLQNGRMLLVSPFITERRPTAATGERRNRLVALLADQIVVIHAEAGGRIEALIDYCKRQGKKVTCLS